jgi:putative transposase
MSEHKPADVQLSFMKYTAQMLLKELRSNDQQTLENLRVNAQDRKYQVWKRNALGVSLWSQPVFKQKLDYIHNNPVKAGLCRYAEDYKYSSAAFYEKGTSEWRFLTHYLV